MILNLEVNLNFKKSKKNEKKKQDDTPIQDEDPTNAIYYSPNL